MISYKPLLETLKKRNMTASALESIVKKQFVSRITVEGSNLTTDLLNEVCKALDCGVEDVCCFTREEPEERLPRFHMDWAYLKECSVETGISIYSISKRLSGYGKYLAQKQDLDTRLSSRQIEIIADMLGHKPEEFIID